jgi:hypothetical protein
VAGSGRSRGTTHRRWRRVVLAQRARRCMAWRQAQEKKVGEEEERTARHQPSREEKEDRAEGGGRCARDVRAG